MEYTTGINREEGVIDFACHRLLFASMSGATGRNRGFLIGVFCLLLPAVAASLTLQDCINLFRSQPIYFPVRSLQLGTPPGISLHGRDILEIHVLEMFEPDVEPFQWVRLLARPVRRQFGHFGVVENMLARFASPPTLRRIPVNDSKFRLYLGEGGVVKVVMTFEEFPLPDGYYYYICSDVVQGQWLDDSGVRQRQPVLKPALVR